MTVEVSPLFVFPYHYRLAFVISPPVTDLRLRSPTLLVFTDTNPRAVYYTSHCLHPTHSMDKI